MSAMTMLDAHLEQISLCAASIAELPFPPPKIFTNALLQPHDITALIRDTELHERALFSVPPAPPVPKAQDPAASSNSNRRNTTFNINGGGSTNITGGGANAVRAPRRNTAVAAVLGTELVERIRRGGGGGAGTGVGYRAYDNITKHHEVDVETLLEGAEKLLGVYPIPGARERIAALRQRHSRLQGSIEHYEYRIVEQTAQLDKVYSGRSRDYDDEPEVANTELEPPAFVPMNEEDLKREEEEVRQLERKRKGLEDRVHNMNRDISGVLR